MATGSRPRRVAVLGRVLAIIGILVCGVVGYWRYASYVPPFRPELPPMPSPNGYVRAEQLVAQLYAKVPQSGLLRYQWLSGSLNQRRSQLAPVRPILNQVRATFHS